MKIRERLALLKAGYTRSDIDEMIRLEAEENENADVTETETGNSDITSDNDETMNKIMIENANLKKQIEEMQKQNISTSEQEKPKEETSADVWCSFFGDTNKE